MDKLLKIIKGYLISAALFLIIMLVLSILMLIGRLEIFTVLILFTQAFWKK